MYAGVGKLRYTKHRILFCLFSLTNMAEEMSQRMLEECDVVMNRFVSVHPPLQQEIEKRGEDREVIALATASFEKNNIFFV